MPCRLHYMPAWRCFGSYGAAPPPPSSYLSFSDSSLVNYSTEELIQVFEARWSKWQMESHFEAGRRVDRVRAAAFELIRERTRNGRAAARSDSADGGDSCRR